MLLVGLLGANFLGRRLIGMGEALLNRLPLVRAVYRTSQEIVSAVALPRGRRLQEPVLIEFPRRGVHSYGFVTGYVELEGPEGPVTLANVYVPSPPMPTSGQLVAVPVAEVTFLDISSEEAMKLIVSGGLVAPETLRRRPG